MATTSEIAQQIPKTETEEKKQKEFFTHFVIYCDINDSDDQARKKHAYGRVFKSTNDAFHFAKQKLQEGFEKSILIIDGSWREKDSFCWIKHPSGLLVHDIVCSCKKCFFLRNVVRFNPILKNCQKYPKWHWANIRNIDKKRICETCKDAWFCVDSYANYQGVKSSEQETTEIKQQYVKVEI